MAGHSHWAGIKHKKDRADKQRSKYLQSYQKKLQLLQNLGQKSRDES